jgi:hypothetical protein
MEQPKTKLGSITGSNGDNATNTKYSDQAALITGLQDQISLINNTIAPLASVTIGSKLCKKQLDVTTYRDSTTIPQVTDENAWENLKQGLGVITIMMQITDTYGKLYNWYAVMGIQ